MAQRISRAKATLQKSSAPFTMPSASAYPQRLRSVLHVLYLIYNEGYTASGGPELARPDLSAEAIRLARMVHGTRPDDPEITGLLALMLLTEARRPARSGRHGELIPLEAQDRAQWDRTMIREGLELLTSGLRQHRPGDYQLQAAIAALHAQAPSYEATSWEQVLALYNVLTRLSPNPIVALNRAIAVAMVHGPGPALEAVDALADVLEHHHRFHAVRAHLLERARGPAAALAAYEMALQRVTNLRERDYLRARVAALRSNA